MGDMFYSCSKNEKRYAHVFDAICNVKLNASERKAVVIYMLFLLSLFFFFVLIPFPATVQ
jgi:hypothetical protein